MHISDNSPVSARAHANSQTAGTLKTETTAKINFRYVGIIHKTPLKVAVYPSDKQDDIPDCLQNCDLPDNFFIALVNNIRIHLSAPQHKPEETANDKDSRRISLISQDQRMEHSYGSTIDGRFRKRCKNAKSNTVIQTGTVFADRTFGDMGKVSGLLHYVADVCFEESEQAKVTLPLLPSELTELTAVSDVQSDFPDQLLEADNFLKTNKIACSLDQVKSASSNGLTASFKSMFKQLSQREAIDFKYRDAIDPKEEVSKKEKTLLFFEDNETILNFSLHKFFYALNKALYDSESDKPDNILFLTTTSISQFERTFKNIMLSNLKKELLKLINIIENANSKYKDKDDHFISGSKKEVKSLLTEIKKTFESKNQKELITWINEVESLAFCCKNIYLFMHNKQYNKDKSKEDKIFDTITLLVQLNQTLDVLMSFISNSTDTSPETFIVLAELLTYAIKILEEKNKFYLLHEQQQLINNTISSFFTSPHIDIRAFDLFEKSTLLFQCFIKRKYLSQASNTIQQKDQAVNLKITEAFIDNITTNCNEKSFIYQQDNKIDDELLRNYLKYFLEISNYYQKISHASPNPRKKKLDTITSELQQISNELIDKQWATIPRVSEKGNKIKKPKKKK